jgi:hypothetical protein
MIKLVITFFLLISGTTNAQFGETISLNTEYISIVETICEETSEPNPCAGQEIYLILKFNTTKVHITQKMVSTCDEEHIQNEFVYKWNLNEDNEIKIFYNQNEIKYTSLENLKLVLKDKVIYGYKNRGDNQSEKYIFSNK